MNDHIFSARSRQSLAQVCADLTIVTTHALVTSSVDFVVTEGARSRARQERLVQAGASQTRDSRHLPDLDGRCYAVDVAAVIDGEVRWDWPLYETIARAMKNAGERFGIPVEWGGDWPTLRDGPHFQLPRAEYPGHYRNKRKRT